MKPQDQKQTFIELRAENKSYSSIAKTLRISKATCTAWERELKKQIAELKREQLAELYETYYMTREARIKRLGDTLTSINRALSKCDFTKIAPERLLDYQLKYIEALKEEYVPFEQGYQFDNGISPLSLMEALADLLSRIQAGDTTTDQAARETLVIANLIKAYDVIEIKKRLDALDAIVGGR